MNIISYHQLHLILADIEFQSANSASFKLFNGPKINMLHQKNGNRVKTLQEFMAKNVAEFAKKDLNGKPLTVINPETGVTELAFENELDKIAYMKAYEEFGGKTFDLNF